jgi:hypothetical protein
MACRHHDALASKEYTMSIDLDQAMNDALAAFGTPSDQLPTTRTVAVQGADLQQTIVEKDDGGVPLVLIDGNWPGTIPWVPWTVRIEQVIEDEDDAVLRTLFDPREEEGDIRALARSIREQGGLLDPLVVVYRGDRVTLGTEELPAFRIRIGKRRRAALLSLRESGDETGYFAPIRILRPGLTDGQILLMAISQQENQKPLSLWDRSYAICRLVKAYGYGVDVIAAHTGYSTAKVSRHAAAGELGMSSPLIATYMRQDSLKFEHLAKMIVNNHPQEHLDGLERVAEYAVQSDASADRVEAILRGMYPEFGIEPYYDLVRSGQTNRPELVRLASKAQGEVASHAADRHVWRLNRPLLVSETRVTRAAKRIRPIVGGTARKPVVSLESLGSFNYFTARDTAQMPDADLLEVMEQIEADREAIYRVWREQFGDDDATPGADNIIKITPRSA